MNLRGIYIYIYMYIAPMTHCTKSLYKSQMSSLRQSLSVTFLMMATTAAVKSVKIQIMVQLTHMVTVVLVIHHSQVGVVDMMTTTLIQ